MQLLLGKFGEGVQQGGVVGTNHALAVEHLVKSVVEIVFAQRGVVELRPLAGRQLEQKLMIHLLHLCRSLP